MMVNYPDVYKENDNDVRLRGLTALNPLGVHTSSSRGQMQSNAVTQHCVTSGAEPKTIQSGAEREYGKFTYSIFMPHDGEIIAVIPRYLPSPHNGIQFNPQTIVIYRSYDSDDNRPLYGCIDVTKYASNHSKFGYEFKPTKRASELQVGNSISAGTILYDSPAKDELGNYNMGRNLKTLYSSLEGTIEDSILIAKDVLPFLKTSLFYTRTFELGSNEFPLNLYGDENTYKVMPDIGEYCSPTGVAYNGLVIAKRHFNPDLIPVTFTNTSTRIYDDFTDTPLDGSGTEPIVVDIIVYRQNKQNPAVAPKVLEQLDKYADAYIDFCQRIMREYVKIQAQHSNPKYTDEFDQLIKHCMAITNEKVPDDKMANVSIQKITNFSRKLDDYTIIVTTMCEKELGIGYKVSDLYGGKGVVGDIIPVEPSQMPYDPVTGERADIVISPETTFNRMNPGRVYEQTLNASRSQFMRELYQLTGLNKTVPSLKEKVLQLPKDILQKCFERMDLFLYIVSQKQWEAYQSWSEKEKALDLYHCLKDTLYIYWPLNNPRDTLKVFKALKEHGYLDDPRPLKFWNPYTQEEETTRIPMRLGDVYYICLEKIGDDFAAVSTSATQPNGIPVPITSTQKHQQQIRQQPTKFPGETESRIIVTSAPSGTAAVMHDRSNNPDTVEEIIRTIYSTDTPTNIDAVVDYSVSPLGNGRPIQMVNHYLQCAGHKLEYREFDPSQQALGTINPITGSVAMDVEGGETPTKSSGYIFESSHDEPDSNGDDDDDDE